jgi:hypothetical protein
MYDYEAVSLQFMKPFHVYSRKWQGPVFLCLLSRHQIILHFPSCFLMCVGFARI